MVVLTKITTKTGDDGASSLATGERFAKSHPRFAAIGAVDEVNAALGVCLLHVHPSDPLYGHLRGLQNDLFDLGADLATPDRGADLGFTPLRLNPARVEALEILIEAINAELPPLTSFVLPGGSALAAHLHVARTIARRAERDVIALTEGPGETVSGPVRVYLNRLSDFLFVASRQANAPADSDVLWRPGGV